MTDPLTKLDLNLLRVFDTLMQERHVTRAAQTLHLSQSTVSHALARLRQSLDDPLFIISRRAMLPTTRALALATPVRQALALLEQGLRQVAEFAPHSSERSFRLALSGSIEYGLLPDLVARLAQRAPLCRLEVCELIDIDYERELERGALDLVIGLAGANRFSSRLQQTAWFSEPLVCLSPALSDLPNTLNASDMLRWPHIHTSSWGHSQARLDAWLAQAEVTRQIAVRLPSFLAVPALMASGRYLVVLPQMIGRDFAARYNLRCHALTPAMAIEYVLVEHPLSQHDAALAWLKDQLHALVATP
ncbi:MAG: LysR family transcriptional regulator [Aeromonas sp.]